MAPFFGFNDWNSFENFPFHRAKKYLEKMTNLSKDNWSPFISPREREVYRAIAKNFGKPEELPME